MQVLFTYHGFCSLSIWSIWLPAIKLIGFPSFSSLTETETHSVFVNRSVCLNIAHRLVSNPHNLGVSVLFISLRKTSEWEKLDFLHYLPMRTLYNMMKNGDTLSCLYCFAIWKTWVYKSITGLIWQTGEKCDVGPSEAPHIPASQTCWKAELIEIPYMSQMSLRDCAQSSQS